MGQVFGEAWIRNNGATAPAMWIAAIRKLTDVEIRRGLEAIATTDRKYKGITPSLPEFYSLCQPNGPVRQEPAQHEWRASKLGRAGNLRLWILIMDRGGVPDDLIRTLVAEKNEVVAEYEDRDPKSFTRDEFIVAVDAAIEERVET